jgi:hypothetical protein
MVFYFFFINVHIQFQIRTGWISGVTDPDPTESFGSFRIRAQNTGIPIPLPIFRFKHRNFIPVPVVLDKSTKLFLPVPSMKRVG